MKRNGRDVRFRSRYFPSRRDIRVEENGCTWKKIRRLRMKVLNKSDVEQVED